MDPTTLLERCRQYEQDGRPNVEVGTRDWTDEEDRLRARQEHKEAENALKETIDKYPRGEGLYEITPFIPMEQLRWYRLEIQGKWVQIETCMNHAARKTVEPSHSHGHIVQVTSLMPWIHPERAKIISTCCVCGLTPFSATTMTMLSANTTSGERKH